MTRSEIPAGFATLRTWDGSRSRAFEELCYQLLREPNDLPANNATAIRTGNPDGGVEWYVSHGDSEWGWQAKYISNIDDLLGAMTESVKRVARERSQLTRLTFCIPWNLPTGTSGRERVSARMKYERKVERWKKTIEGAEDIEFLLMQESDLIDRLSMDKHRGRRFFWFHEEYIGPQQLAELYEIQSDVAGARYRPELQVDLPIGEDLQALGFADSYLDELRAECLRLQSDRWHLRLPNGSLGPKTDAALKQAHHDCEVIATVVAAEMWLADAEDPLDRFATLVDQAMTSLEVAREAIYQAQAQARTEDPSAEGERKAEGIRRQSYDLLKFGRSVEALREFVHAPATHAMRRRSYFLTGGAGAGKTHLFLDSTRQALAEGRPAAVIFGVQIGKSDLWASICSQLGLPNLGQRELLGALDACGEASSKMGRRFVLMIDALNDSTPPSYWAAHLAALRAAVSHWPHVALAVSCRDTYLDAVDPEGRRNQFAQRVHPGFAGREIEATHRYFEYYGLEEPRIPLLLPEFSVPLFLAFYCEGLRDLGQTAPLEHHESRVAVFERFIATKLKRAQNRVGPDAANLEAEAITDGIRDGLAALLQEMGETGRETITRSRTDQLLQGVRLPTALDPVRLLAALVDEGLLSSEPIYIDKTIKPGIRITFQAFADFLILRQRLGAVTRQELLDDQVMRDWLYGSSTGIIESACVLLPEAYEVELVDYLEPAVRRQAAGESDASRLHNRLVWLESSFQKTLPYRSATSITPRTLELLNRSLRNGHTDDLFEVMFLLAPQPDHPLNGYRLHRYLSQYSMPSRDRFFGQIIYHALENEASAVARLARWAARGPYPEYDSTVIELSALPLCWLLSSPNRFMRDWTTKALVELLRGHPVALEALLTRFLEVNDPYLVERLVTVAYGCVMRSNPADHPSFRGVAKVISDRVFQKGSRKPADAHLLDSARGVVEWAVYHRLLPESRARLAKPRYGLPRPGAPWTRALIEKRFKADYQSPEKSYGSLLSSLFGLDDFGRYVVEPAVHHFSRIPLSQPAPPRRIPIGEPVFVRARWRRFVASLPKGKKKLLEAIDASSDDSEAYLAAYEKLVGSLTPAQHREYIGVWRRPKHQQVSFSYPSERASRWIFQRSLSLGWDPQKFGHFDRWINYGTAGRSGHKEERFGKKYQWIAFHELLARIADNFHVERSYDGQPLSYDGLYEIHDREIDPSLPPIPFKDLHESGEDYVLPSPVTVAFPRIAPDFAGYRGDVARLIADTDSIPFADRTVRLADSDGASWIVLYGRIRHFSVDLGAPDRYGGLEEWAVINSWLSPIAAAGQFASELPRLLREDGWHFDDHGHINCCFLGELTWRSTRCPYRKAKVGRMPFEGLDIPAVSTTEQYSWEGGGFDCSINDTLTVVGPSTFILHRGGLRWSGAMAAWHAPDEQLVAGEVGNHGFDGSSALLIKEDWLRKFMLSQGLELVVGVRGERRKLAGERTYRSPSLGFTSAGHLTERGILEASPAELVVNAGNETDG